MKVTLGATIPTTSYGNVQPQFEVEADTIEAGLAVLEPQLQAMWRRYAEPDKQLPSTGQLIDAFVGGQIQYDDATHSYTWNGLKYLSGSEYAAQFEKPFDGKTIANKMAIKAGIDERDILAMWQLNSEVSMGFGTALHAAVELYGRFRDTAKALNKESNLHQHPILKSAVESFYEAYDGDLVHEAVVVDHARQRAGRLDLIRITGDKRCVVEDIKTNASIESSLPKYWKQLTFYKEIMEAGGWTVEDLVIYHFNGGWTKISNKENT